jgi:hypothetical protein
MDSPLKLIRVVQVVKLVGKLLKFRPDSLGMIYCDNLLLLLLLLLLHYVNWLKFLLLQWHFVLLNMKKVDCLVRLMKDMHFRLAVTHLSTSNSVKIHLERVEIVFRFFEIIFCLLDSFSIEKHFFLIKSSPSPL